MAPMTIKGLKVSERQNYHEYSISRELAKEYYGKFCFEVV